MSDGSERLHDTTDAAVWAAEFCKRWPSALCQIEGQEGISDSDDFKATMVGWFANAIMAGVDSEARKARAEVQAIVAAKLREAARHVHIPEDVSLTDDTCAVVVWSRRAILALIDHPGETALNAAIGAAYVDAISATLAKSRGEK